MRSLRRLGKADGELFADLAVISETVQCMLQLLRDRISSFCSYPRPHKRVVQRWWRSSFQVASVEHHVGTSGRLTGKIPEINMLNKRKQVLSATEKGVLFPFDFVPVYAYLTQSNTKTPSNPGPYTKETPKADRES